MSENTQEAQRQAKPVAPKVKELISKTQSLILATVDAEGTPNASYAPFVEIDNKFYILVSFMAKHTKNLRKAERFLPCLSRMSLLRNKFTQEKD
ncbi:pyridoxamine 5'-phosphate oxidase family protein [Epilithonimonas sp. UC225_85]|uniref:pyridoxamine 5'-phosphate oxidase family protein n=1 Tax=Epilithonimonas sp. UC225_85 TaxID=3350167 RepID=UPI0036D412B2